MPVHQCFAHTQPVGPCFAPAPWLNYPTHGVWTCDRRGHRSPVAPFATTLCKKPPCNSTWWQEFKNGSPKSSLVSLRGVTSPSLPLGCGRELNGLPLYREQGTASDVLRTAGCNPSHQPPSGRIPSTPCGVRGANVHQRVYGHVVQEVKR